jgi:hypothetical protein
MVLIEPNFWYLISLWWLSGIVGHLSAFWRLEEDSEIELRTRLPLILKNKFGVRKGLLLNFCFWFAIISPLMAYGLSSLGNTNLAYLITGFFLGSLFKQLISAYKEKYLK